MIRSFFLALVFTVVSFSCGPQVGVELLDDGGPGSTGGGGGGGSGAGVTFCDVQPVLQARCGSCHGASPVSGAPQLMTMAQLQASSPQGGTMLDRCIARMSTTPVSAAMPPSVGGTPSDLWIFTNWRDNATAPCAQGTGSGAGGGGGGVAQTTCASNGTWSFGNNLGSRMNPGEACFTCHQARRQGPLAGFMGTVYPALHEAQLCTVTSVPSGVTVEILDTSNVVRRTFTISALSDGNFYGGSVGTPSPYRARVLLNGVVTSEMIGFQTSGDCNVCHTAQGAQGAPGRIHW